MIGEVVTVTEKTKKHYRKKCGNCGKFVDYLHRHKPATCPQCFHVHWDKPPTEVKLFDLQEAYLLDRDNKYLSKMYSILKDYSKSLIYKTLSGSYTFESEVVEEKAHDSAMGIVTYYLKKPGFRIDSSFGGYLKFKIKEVLYADKEEEGHESLNQLINDGSGKEMMEVMELFDYDNLTHHESDRSLIFHDSHQDPHGLDVVNEIVHIVDVINGEIRRNYSPSQAMVVLMGMRNNLSQKSQKFNDSFYRHFGQTANDQVQLGMKAIFSYIKDLTE